MSMNLRFCAVVFSGLALLASGCGKTGKPTVLAQENPPSVPRGKPELPVENKRDWQPLDTEPKPYDVLAYDVDVDFEKISSRAPEFRATLDLTLIPSLEGQQLLSLDAKGLEIESVMLKNEMRDLRFRVLEKNLEIDLGRFYHSPEALTLSIRYRWNKPFNQGLYFTSRNEGTDESETVWTTGEPDDQGWDFSHDPQFKAYVARAQTELVPMIERSAVGISLVTKSEVDIKFAIELGLMIMLDKPIITIVSPGEEVAEKIRLVSDADLATDEGQAAFQEALVKLGLGQ